jgi:hypothetical protein
MRGILTLIPGAKGVTITGIVHRRSIIIPPVIESSRVYWMTKTIVGIFLLSLAICCHAVADDNMIAEACHTNGQVNGRFVDQFSSDRCGKYGSEFIGGYIRGILDGINFMGGDILSKIYPHSSSGEITDAVISYYQNNPTKKYRPIAEVIMAGCE